MTLVNPHRRITGAQSRALVPSAREKVRPDMEARATAVPENLQELMRITREYIDATHADPTNLYSQAVLKGLDAEMNTSRAFQYYFSTLTPQGKRSHLSVRLPLTTTAMTRLDEIKNAYSLSTRQILLTSLARCALTPDGNIILRAMRDASKRGLIVPAPPALDGPDTEFVQLPKPG